MHEPVIHVLDNGLTIAVDRMPQACSARMNLQMKAGSRYDPADAQGMAHFAEHMLFKGAGSMDSDTQAERLEDVGADINAWTSMEHMAIDFHTLPEQLPMCIGIAADMVQRPWLRDTDIASERGVVLSEMDGLNDDDLLMDVVHSTAYPGQPYSWRTIGQVEHLEAITGDTMRAWLSDRVRARDMVLSIAGGVDAAQAIDAAAAAFGGLPDLAPSPEPEVPVFHEGRGTERARMGQGSLAVMWDAPSLRDPRRIAWNMAMKVLGGSPSSRLFRRLRQELGLCYDVQSSLHCCVDVGQAMVQVVTDPSDVKRAWREIRGVIERAASDVAQDELDRARTRARAGILMSRDNVRARCDSMAYELIEHGRIVPVEEALHRLEAVTLADVRQVLADIVSAPRVVVNVGGGAAAIAG